MKRRLFLSCLGFAIVLGLTHPVSAETLNQGGKIAPRVLAETQNGKTTEALVVLSEQADLRPAYSLQTKEQKGEFAVNTLREVANRTQPPIVRMLDSLYDALVKQSHFVLFLVTSRRERRYIAANPSVLNLKSGRIC